MAERKSERRTTFDRLFADGTDPWDLEHSAYERDKRSQTLAALADARYRHGLEIGCATGLLTAMLAPRCEMLLAIDVSETALERARDRLGGLPQVRFERREIPGDWPPGEFDLIIFSEVLYFLSAGEIAATARRAHSTLAGGSTCLLVNWTGENDLPVGGAQAARLFADAASWSVHDETCHENYRIDLLRR